MTDWTAELTDARRWMRRRAACALSKMPGAALGAVGALTRALDDKDLATREWAAEALRNLESSFPELRRLAG